MFAKYLDEVKERRSRTASPALVSGCSGMRGVLATKWPPANYSIGGSSFYFSEFRLFNQENI